MSDSQEGPTTRSKGSRMVGSVAERAQEVIKQDLGNAKSVAYDAAKSRAYLYPIKGIFYFLTHRDLWKPFIDRLGPYVVLSVSVIGGMFTLTYVPQLAIMFFVNGPLAVFTTVVLILNESSSLISTISRGWLLQDALLDTFDGTLVSRGSTEMLSGGRELKPGGDAISRLGKAVRSPFQKLSPTALVRYIMYLPLNFIPVVGTGIFIALQARNRGKNVHGRYFQLKKWSNPQQEEWLEKHKGPYTAFGFVATLLEMIPIASMFFTYTNAVGAALWASDIESMSTSMTDGTAPALRDSAEKLE